ncbi:MAG: creatininase family protein [Candidatus Heimdallarchaeota archaeon]|nr:creatininase family protein [Candidatus Heimdallarchaeota archaeon]MCK4769073.1 creatininase family protein [Candidatus Heimdallarchaeota archaeon]
MTHINKDSSEETILSVNLENLSWIEAEKIMEKYEVVLIALGSRLKEHGPHLPLNNDYIMAEQLMKLVIKQVAVIVLPTLQYGFYPSFLEYPGSVSINEETFKEYIIDICKSMNGYGKRKFYILNTGISTLRPLKKAAEELEKSDIVLSYLNILEIETKIEDNLLQQEGGTHADEGETSIMLYLAPEIVNMNKAIKDYDSRSNRKGLTRNPEGSGLYSPSGVYGDSTLATREKGKILVESIVNEVVSEIEKMIES